MLDNIMLFLKNENFNLFMVVLALFCFLWGSFNKIKYSCLKKASELVAEVEALENISGEQKFALVVTWIGDELPKIFKLSVFQTVIEKIIQFAYDTSFGYMQNYIERKTGKKVNKVLSEINSNKEESEEVKNK